MSTTKSDEKGKQVPRSAAEAGKAVEHFTVAERAARGKAARAEVPRASHADWEAPHVRVDPIALLEEQARAGCEELVPIRYGRMLVSPFTFYRGAAYIMACRPRGNAADRVCTCSSAATRTCPTSAGMPRPTGGSCST